MSNVRGVCTIMEEYEAQYIVLLTLQKSCYWLEHGCRDWWIMVICCTYKAHEPIERMAMAHAACLASRHMCHRLPMLQPRSVSAPIGHKCRYPFLRKCINTEISWRPVGWCMTKSLLPLQGHHINLAPTDCWAEFAAQDDTRIYGWSIFITVLGSDC